MGAKDKPVKVVAVGSGAGIGPLGGLGVGAAFSLFIVNGFIAFLVISGMISIVSTVMETGFSMDPVALVGVLGGVLAKVSSSASAVSFMLYIDIVAFAIVGITLVIVRIKLPACGSSAIVAAIGAFAFAGLAYYLRFSMLPPILSAFDQIAMAGASVTGLILLLQAALQMMSFTTLFLVQGILFFIFGMFMRKTVNNINHAYGKMTRGGALILSVSITNLISMSAIYYATGVLRSVLGTVISSLGGGGGMPDITGLLTPLVAMGIGVFLKLIIIPILATFAFLSLTFGFWGIARGPKA